MLYAHVQLWAVENLSGKEKMNGGGDGICYGGFGFICNVLSCYFRNAGFERICGRCAAVDENLGSGPVRKFAGR